MRKKKVMLVERKIKNTPKPSKDFESNKEKYKTLYLKLINLWQEFVSLEDAFESWIALEFKLKSDDISDLLNEAITNNWDFDKFISEINNIDRDLINKDYIFRSFKNYPEAEWDINKPLTWEDLRNKIEKNKHKK